KDYQILSNFWRLFHRYHVAILLYGLHLSPSFSVSFGFGSSCNENAIWTPFLNPRSPTGNTSSLPSEKIKNISAVHLPMPLTCVSCDITSSSLIFGNFLISSLPSSTCFERSLR